MLPIESILLGFEVCYRETLTSKPLFSVHPPMSSYICKDILLQILKCLPVKSLLRFRCVCKWMKQTIGENSFVLAHLSRQNSRFFLQTDNALHERAFFVLDPNTLPLIDSLSNPFRESCILGTLHGVVCLYDDTIGLRLWNPSTHQFYIPPLPKIINFTCSCNDRYYCCAFWIDPSTRDFKVIVCHSPDLDVQLEAVLYNSIEGRWMVLPVERRIPNFRFIRMGNSANPALMIGAVAYWIFLYAQFPDKRGIVSVILSFDFVMERFEFINIPPNNPRMSYPQHFKWQGNLSIVFSYTYLWFPCSIYSRRNGSWNIMYLYELTFLSRRVFWVTGETEQGGRALAMNDDHLVLYDPRDGIIPLNEVNWDSGRSHMVYDYVESLMFPYH